MNNGGICRHGDNMGQAVIYHKAGEKQMTKN